MKPAASACIAVAAPVNCAAADVVALTTEAVVRVKALMIGPPGLMEVSGVSLQGPYCGCPSLIWVTTQDALGAAVLDSTTGAGVVLAGGAGAAELAGGTTTTDVDVEVAGATSVDAGGVAGVSEDGGGIPAVEETTGQGTT